MADAVIINMESLEGVKRCIEYQIKRISWRDYLWIIPLFKNIPFYGVASEREIVKLLADSLILTTVLYRESLNSRPYGTRYNFLYEIIMTLEWLCWIVYKTHRLDPENDELLVVLDFENVTQLIYPST